MNKKIIWNKIKCVLPIVLCLVASAVIYIVGVSKETEYVEFPVSLSGNILDSELNKGDIGETTINNIDVASLTEVNATNTSEINDTPSSDTYTPDEEVSFISPNDYYLQPADTKGNNLVNINTAGKNELMTLSGIGESKALAIIDYREKNGAFSTLEDIMKVPGIKQGTFDKIKDKITL